MKNRLLATFAFTLSQSWAAHGQAQGVTAIQDCAVLDELVRQHVAAEIRREYRPDGRTPRSLMPESGESLLCSATAEVVSRAFAGAFAAFGIGIRWDYLRSEQRHACMTRHIGVCNPFADPSGPSLSPGDRALISRTWRRIRVVVTLHMPMGTASDISYFEPSSLAKDLSSSRGHLVGEFTIADMP